MIDEKRDGQSGGIFLALGPFAGLVPGFALGQPSAGLLGGIAAGAILATVFWLRTR